MWAGRGQQVWGVENRLHGGLCSLRPRRAAFSWPAFHKFVLPSAVQSSGSLQTELDDFPSFFLLLSSPSLSFLPSFLQSRKIKLLLSSKSGSWGRDRVGQQRCGSLELGDVSGRGSSDPRSSVVSTAYG